MKESKSTIYFENLDGLRFLCFLLVFLRHSLHTENIAILESPIYKFIKFQVFGSGTLGVNFFFVLSGYLITYLLIEEKNNFGKINIKNFWTRRALRIWPLYFTCVFIGFVVFPLIKEYFSQTSNESAHLLSYLTFTHNFDVILNGNPDSSILATLWTIAIEEQFYFIWPILLAFVPIKKYWIIFTTVIAGSLFYRATHDNHYLHKLHTFSCMGDLAVGAFGAWAICYYGKFKIMIKTLKASTLIVLYTITAVCYFFYNDIFGTNFLTRVFSNLVLSILFIIIILEQCYTEKSLFKMVNNKIFSRLGKISYGLYCLHSIGILIILTITAKWNLSLTGILLIHLPISLLLSIGLSILSYHYLEKPFLRLKERFRKSE